LTRMVIEGSSAISSTKEHRSMRNEPHRVK
jgi:hypothetical protein